jgi:predicted RNA-binding Zn-ribbon protein involved in translation (DUF1610 family)
MEQASDLVRCLSCGHEYELTSGCEEIGCPDCGGISWIAASIRDETPQTPTAA